MKTINKILLIILFLFTITFLLGGCQTQKNSAANPLSNTTLTDNSSKPSEIKALPSVGYNTKIQEILETDTYINRFLNLTGKVESSQNSNFDGYIVDDQGYKLFFKLAQKRGFNSQKQYIFFGEVVGANSTKYLQVTRGVYEVGAI
jgi:hypothetical protein